MLERLKANKTTLYSLTILLFISFIVNTLFTHFSSIEASQNSKSRLESSQFSSFDNGNYIIPSNINFFETVEEEELEEFWGNLLPNFNFSNGFTHISYNAPISAKINFDFNQTQLKSIPLYLKYHHLKIHIL